MPLGTGCCPLVSEAGRQVAGFSDTSDMASIHEQQETPSSTEFKVCGGARAQGQSENKLSMVRIWHRAGLGMHSDLSCCSCWALARGEWEFLSRLPRAISPCRLLLECGGWGIFEQRTQERLDLPRCSFTVCGRDEVLTKNSLSKRERNLMPPATRESREEAVKDWSNRRQLQNADLIFTGD